jgi:CDP-diacylglycerol--glycerol-3-phosphate 3-phosphatidyltransferase
MSTNWVCPQCNAYNPPRRNRCWQCGTVRGESAPSVLLGQADGALKTLRGYWFGYVALCLVSLGAGYGVLRLWWTSVEILLWLFWGVGLVGIEAALLLYRLPANHQKDVTQLSPSFRTSTFLTLVRAVLLALVVGFGGLSCKGAVANCSLAVNSATRSALRNWTPAILFAIILLLCYIEKILLRREGASVTVLDVQLNRDVDMLGIFVASVLGQLFWRLPTLYLLVPITYFLFRAGVWRRKRRGMPVNTLPANVLRPLMLQSHVVFSGIALWPFWRGDVDEVATILMLVFVTYLIKDWLFVVGVLDPASPTYRKINTWVEKVVSFGPIVLRVLFVLSLIQLAFLSIFVVGQFVSEPPDPQAFEKALPFITAIILVFGLAFLMIVFGVAGRIAALILLLMSFWFPIPFRALPFYLAMFLYLGTGKLSLWTEDALLARWIMADSAVRHFDKRNPQLLQNSAISEIRTALDVPMPWQEPIKLSETVKVVIGVATFVLFSGYVLYIVFMLLMMIAFISQGVVHLPDLVENSMPFAWTFGVLLTVVQFGLIGFYLIHVIKNIGASDTVRIILGIGMLLLPPIAMPIYYWTYFHDSPPPIWARKKA